MTTCNVKREHLEQCVSCGFPSSVVHLNFSNIGNNNVHINTKVHFYISFFTGL